MMTQQNNTVPPLPPVQPQSAGQPLSLADYGKLEQATRSMKKLRAAAGLAAFNGYTFAIFATISAMFVLVGFVAGDIDFIGIIISAGLGVVAYNELKGRRMLLNFDRRAPKLLGWNQIGLLALIIFYCVWNIISAYTGPGAYEKEIAANPELKEMLGPGMDNLVKNITVLIYGTVIIASVLFQGINAIYYFTRKKLLDSHLRETPQWIIEVQKRTASQ